MLAALLRKENAIRCRRIPAVLGAMLVAAMVPIGLARATAPAQNGEIAFARRSADASSAIYVVRADGSGERRLTRPPATFRDDRPDWAPSGAFVVFERCAPGGSCGIHSVKADGSGARRLSPRCPKAASACRYQAPAFSPDGRRIAYLYATGSLAVASSALRRQRIVAGPRKLQGSADAPAWSPEGTRLAFGVIRGDGSGSTAKDGRAVFVVRADGKGLRRLTPWSLRAGDRPDWAPDGQSILVRSFAEREGGVGSNLYAVRPDGSGLRAVTQFSADRRVLTGAYAPDGTAIAIATSERSSELPDLYLVRPDGSGARRITTSGAWDASPDWGPRR